MLVQAFIWHKFIHK
uniref:Uncharacterized protein n=1 Tax=Rhizophora mucronata TaxID=61149 RepID=A0A2P2NEB1_RHIMU